MQTYLLDGDRDTRLAKLIFKARGQTLDLKMQKRWKYGDTLCSGCRKNEETGEEIFECKSFGENSEKITYNWFFKENSKQVIAAKVLTKKLKLRDKIREEVT